MNSPANTQLSPPSEESANLFVTACTVEIVIHLVVLFLAIVPIVLLVFPVAIGALLSTILVNAAAVFFTTLQSYETTVSDSFWTLALILAAIALIVSGLSHARYIKNTVAAEAKNDRCKPLRGAKGDELIQIVQRLWLQLGGKSAAPPSVVWFASPNILAHAREVKGSKEIQISIGLWDRAVRKDPIATTILAHEMAHLINHDGIVFRHLQANVAATRNVMRTLGVFGLITFVILLLQPLKTIMSEDFSPRIAVLHFLSTIILAILVLLIIPLCVLVVRRYVGFITSLLEVRADISAARWTGGREEFVKIFTADTSIRHSTVGDHAHSMLSLNLTHISETERITLLRAPEQLATPKLRYFTLSLLLPMLLPIGFLTPLLLGGSINHLLVTVPVIALHFGLLSMIVTTGPSVPGGLSWSRLVVLAGGVCFANALPHLNLELIGYLLAHLAISITQPGGLGVGVTTWQSVLSDIAMTWSDLHQKVMSAIHSGWIVAALIVVMLCLWFIQSRACRFPFSKSQRFGVGMVTAVAGTFTALLVSIDPFRDDLFSFWPLSLAEPLARATEHVAWLRLALPIIVGLICFELQKSSLRLILWRSTKPIMG